MTSDMLRSYPTVPFASIPPFPRPPGSPYGLATQLYGLHGPTMPAAETGVLLPNKVFVGGLAAKTNERDLREAISKLCPIKEVKIITDSNLMSKSGEPRRYAFVELQTDRDEDGPQIVKNIVDHYAKNELELHGRRLNVGLAYKRNPMNKALGTMEALEQQYRMHFQSLAMHNAMTQSYPFAQYAPATPTPGGVPPGSVQSAASPAGMHPSAVAQLANQLQQSSYPMSAQTAQYANRANYPNSQFNGAEAQRQYLMNSPWI